MYVRSEANGEGAVEKNVVLFQDEFWNMKLAKILTQPSFCVTPLPLPETLRKASMTTGKRIRGLWSWKRLNVHIRSAIY